MAKFYYLMICACFCSGLAHAQHSLTGKVVSGMDGSPLTSVTVSIVQTKSLAQTDPEGNYHIDVPAGGTRIRFSMVGYTAVEQEINGRSIINIQMENESQTIDEIVVVGYGTSKSRNLTSAISSVSGKDIAQRKVPQISHALQGAVPGVRVTRSNGSDPSQDATIRIRGNTTIGINDPLVIIDGVPGNLNTISPNDVADITVLKDAAAASIYGSRGAAGVIIVTTARGQSGQTSFNYSYEFGLQRPTRMPGYTNPVQYMTMYNEAMRNDGNVPIWSEDVINNFNNLNKLYPDSFPYTDWQDLLFKNSAPLHNHSFVFTAGTEKIKTKASINYSRADGLYENKSFDRYNMRVNNDFQISNMLSANFDVSYSRSNSRDPQIGKELEPMAEARYIPPTDDYLYEDGRWAPGRTGMNVIATVNDGGFRRNLTNQVDGRLLIKLRPVDGLSFSALVAPRMNFGKITSFTTPINYTDRLTPSLIIFTSKPNPVLSEERPAQFAINGQLLANYDKNFAGGHDLEMMLGYEENYNNSEAFGAGRTGGFFLSNPYLDLGSTSLRTNFGAFTETSLRSLFSRVGYTFKNKYLFQFNGRFDASSRFHRDYRWAFFPSVSAGWILSEENFMQSIKDQLSFLKLRASWGRVGNERIGDYPYQSTVSFGNSLFYNGSQILSQTNGAQVDYALPDISWEKTETGGIGIDAAFFRNKLTVSADYFNKMTTDILLTLDIPRYFGYNAPAQNAGKVSSKGWEFVANWTDKIGDLSFNIGLNISDAKTKIVDLKGTQMLATTAQLEGYEFSSWYGYKSDGLFQNAEEIANSPTLNSSVKPGDVKLLDLNGDNKITAESDRVPLGGSLPRYIYGSNIRLDYKGFDLLVVAQGVGKVTSYLESYQVQPLRGSFGNIPDLLVGNYWSEGNTSQQNMAARYPRLTRTYAGNSYGMSDFWLFDGSYLRIKNITLGYTVKESLSNKLKLQRARIYLSANDLFSVSKFPKGWDPEVLATTYPMLSTFMMGINLTF